MIGWVEKRVAREQAAIAFLQQRGFSVTRVGSIGAVGHFYVSGWSGELSGSQMVEIAVGHGFEADAAPAPTPPPPPPAPPSEPPIAAPTAPVPTISPAAPSGQPEEADVPQVTATINLTGTLADDFRSYVAERDLTQGVAARELIERALAADADEEEAPDTRSQDLAEIHTDDLLDELRRRSECAAHVADLERDLAEANGRVSAEAARADAAEGRLTAVRAAVLEMAE